MDGRVVSFVLPVLVYPASVSVATSIGRGNRQSAARLVKAQTVTIRDLRVLKKRLVFTWLLEDDLTLPGCAAGYHHHEPGRV